MRIIQVRAFNAKYEEVQNWSEDRGEDDWRTIVAGLKVALLAKKSGLRVSITWRSELDEPGEETSAPFDQSPLWKVWQLAG